MKLILEIVPRSVTAFIVKYDCTLTMMKNAKRLLITKRTIEPFTDPLLMWEETIAFTDTEAKKCYEYLKNGKKARFEREYNEEYIDIIDNGFNSYTAVLFQSYKITDHKTSFLFSTTEPLSAMLQRIHTFNDENEIYHLLELHDYERLKLWEQKQLEQRKLEAKVLSEVKDGVKK